MKLYKVTLKLTSAYGTDWQADTIWGHLCWALRFAYGEVEVNDFITACEKGEPPILVSNGFPGDLLPRPIMPAKQAVNRKEYGTLKEQKEIKLLSLDEFNRVLNNEEIEFSQKGERFATTSIMPKNQINRLSNTTSHDDDTSGRLFSMTEYHLETVSVYLKIADSFVETAKELFQNLSMSGYGKRKTVGYGQFKMLSFVEFTGFNPPVDSNAFISLSNFTPATNDPVNGYWNTLIKYGKLGEEYAITGNPHKQPLVMLRAGSCFYDNPTRGYYGRLVKGLSQQYPHVVQYGYALPVPLKLPAL